MTAKLEMVQQVRRLLEATPRRTCRRVGCSSLTCSHRRAYPGTHCLYLSAYLYYRFLRTTVGIPERYISATLENADSDFKNHPEKTCYDRAQLYVANYRKNLQEGRSILLTGPLGSGKTYLATAIAQALIDRGVGVMWRTADGIISELMAAFERKDGSADKLRKRLYTVPILVIDEFGANIGTDVGRAELAAVINNRYNLGGVMFLTHNIKKETLKELPDDYRRMWDRLIHRSERFVVELRSYRKPESLSRS